jgi:hypothetical protein
MEMLMPKESLAVKGLLDQIKLNRDSSTRGYYRKFDIPKIMNYVTSLSDKEIKKLVSDSFWLRYPSYVCFNSLDSRRGYGGVIFSIVETCCSHIPRLKNLLIKNADGIFAVASIDYLSGPDRVKICSRMFKSKDVRARLRAAKYLPINKAKRLLGDSRASVRNAVIKRVGVDNCANELVDDKDVWIRKSAISSAEISRDKLLSIIEELTVEAETSSGWGDRWILLAAIEKLSTEDLLYRFEEAKKFRVIEEFINKRLLYAEKEKE